MASDTTSEATSLFITGLKDAHGVEHQALALMDRQLNIVTNYPEVADMLRRHRAETEGQIARLDEILDGFDTKASVLKDTALSITGNLAALAHVPAPDAIIKNSFANHAFEHFEMAAYTGLLTLAAMGGHAKATPLLQQTLEEERRMADWTLSSLPDLVRKYVARREAGETASH
jgi:ferritin-like metal-binding protein YciE